jgi:predicted nucleic-acid-binding protein
LIPQRPWWLASKWHKTNSDFEDNLVHASFKRASADLLVTWDKQLLAHAFVPTVTPTDALKELED